MKVLLIATLFFITICLMQAKIEKKDYSYLPNPPIRITYQVKPDKAIYEKGEIISFNVMATLDTISCDPNAEYGIFFDNLTSLLSHSELVEPTVDMFYPLTKDHYQILISFQVSMKEKFSPPFIMISAFRNAVSGSTAKKKLLSHVIDQYTYFFFTSRAYAHVRNSDIGSTDN
jgi:hypothetical protein